MSIRLAMAPEASPNRGTSLEMMTSRAAEVQRRELEEDYEKALRRYQLPPIEQHR
jgi:hypothetical protein